MLFDEFERTDSRPARSQEGSFAFLNRISTPWWSKVRQELEKWFAEYERRVDAEKVADLRARFRSRNDRQHLAAWWELYLFRLLQSLYPRHWVGVEPTRPGEATKPDFCLASDREAAPELWVEAATTFSDLAQRESRHAAREAYVIDAINELSSPYFRLWITFRAVGDAQPKKRTITDPLEAWLSELDYVEVMNAWQRGERKHHLTLTPDGWEIHLEAMPKGTIGVHPNDRLIGVGPMSIGYVNDAARARQTIKQKAGHYGELDAPFVVAVLPSSPFFGADQALDALFGSEAIQIDPDRPDAPPRVVRRRDGAWSQGRGGNVSGVLFGPGVLPWTVAKTWPQLWLNPAATRPVPSTFAPCPRVEVLADGSLTFDDPNGAPAALFRLPSSWPGEQEPFDP